MQQQHRPEQFGDIRLKATTIIWGWATGMLGLCIPLAQITHSGLIPLTVIVGAVLGTRAVWRADTSKVESKGINQENEQIRQLEERLANLEVIDNFERHRAEREHAIGEAVVRQPESAETFVTGTQQRELA